MKNIAPSFLSADIWRVAEQLTQLELAGCQYLHLDVMDGAFVPNISFGSGIIKSIRPHTKMIFDTHLMVEEPDRFLEDYAAAGADILTVHAEACRHLHRTVQRIRSLGMKPGVSLNPATPISVLEEIIADVDLVLVMSVNPGFGGQKFIPGALDKLRRLAVMRDNHNLDFVLEVDGGVNVQNVGEISEAGADLLVAGSAVFGAADCAEAYNQLMIAVQNK